MTVGMTFERMGMQREERRIGADLVVEERAERAVVKTDPTTLVETKRRAEEIEKRKAVRRAVIE